MILLAVAGSGASCSSRCECNPDIEEHTLTILFDVIRDPLLTVSVDTLEVRE